MLRITPQLGSLDIRSAESEAFFRLLSQGETSIASGTMPALLSQIPIGEYKVVGLHYVHARQARTVVEKGKTNRVDIALLYAALLINSQPQGAEIVSDENHTLGKTPMLIHEVELGTKGFELRLQSFEPAKISLEAKANETNRTSVKLVSVDFVKAVRDGKEGRQKGDYDQAIACFLTALRAKPRDSELQFLLNNSRRSRGLYRAEKSANSQDFKASIVELEALIAAFPNDEVVNRMLGEYSERENARKAAAESNRSDRAKSLFASLLGRIWTGTFSSGMRLSRLCRCAKPSPKSSGFSRPIRRLRRIDTQRTSRTHLKSKPSRNLERRFKHLRANECASSLAPRSRKERQRSRFRSLSTESKRRQFSIGNVIGTPVAVKYIPLRETPNVQGDDKNRTRIQEGVQLVKAKVSDALRR